MENFNNEQQVEQVTEPVDLTSLGEKVNQDHEDAQQTHADLQKDIAEYQQRIAEFEQEQFNMQLKHEGIGYAGEFLDKLNGVASNDDKITILVDFINEVKKQNAYIPQEIAQQDAYTQAQANNDAKGMIGSKFSKFFGK